MSDNVQQDDADLFDSTNPDNNGADAVNPTEEKDTLLESEDEQTEELELEEPVKKVDTSKAEVERQKQIDAWAGRVMSGKITLEELPKDTQWLKPYILEKMEAQQKTPEIEQLVEKKLAEREEQKTFNSLKAALGKLKLNSIQRSELQAEFKDLLEAGLSKAKALTKAMKLAGIPLDSEDQDRLIARQRMAVPQGTYGKVEDSKLDLNDPDFFKKMPRDRKGRQQVLKDMLSGSLD